VTIGAELTRKTQRQILVAVSAFVISKVEHLKLGQLFQILKQQDCICKLKIFSFCSNVRYVEKKRYDRYNQQLPCSMTARTIQEQREEAEIRTLNNILGSESGLAYSKAPRMVEKYTYIISTRHLPKQLPIRERRCTFPFPPPCRHPCAAHRIIPNFLPLLLLALASM
jgi:hypothetical protein